MLFFFNDTATPEIYTLSLHDALPISFRTYPHGFPPSLLDDFARRTGRGYLGNKAASGTEIIAELGRSEEHTSELQSRLHLVCRLLLEKQTTAVLVAPSVATSPVSALP